MKSLKEQTYFRKEAMVSYGIIYTLSLDKYTQHLKIYANGTDR